MKNLLKKITAAKAEIKESKLKKEGRNEFSKYDYFTPAQIEKLFSDACSSNGLLSKFDLIRNELGVFGQLTLFDIDTAETMVYTMATAIPEIKATNIAQQLGGCVTYTERYLKMSAFGITDNSLDFDTTENTNKRETETKKEYPADERPWLSEKALTQVLDRIATGDSEVAKKTFDAFKMKKEYKDQINSQIEKYK